MYIKKVIECAQLPAVPLATVATLLRPFTVSGACAANNVCVWSDSEKFENSFNTNTFNHLVLDFQTRKLVVEEISEFDCSGYGDSKCYMENQYEFLIQTIYSTLSSSYLLISLNSLDAPELCLPKFIHSVGPSVLLKERGPIHSGNSE